MAANTQLLVLIPVFNDWEVVPLMLDELDIQLAKDGRRARVILVDDGSQERPPEKWKSLPKGAIEKIEILILKRNMGHQRALALGMTYIQANIPCDAVVVMDGDGEDDPADVPRLLKTFEELQGRQFVFAQRMRRSESIQFRIFYQAYRFFHLVLTGIHVRVGNFSVIPRAALDNLVVVSDLWNHYAASVHKARFPYTMIPTHRAKRLAGVTRMNFVGLAVHGLSALSIYGDLIGVRLICALAGLIGLDLIALAFLLVARLFQTQPFLLHVDCFTVSHDAPGFFDSVGFMGLIALLVGGLMMLLLMMQSTSLFVFLVLGSRDNTRFLPARDYAFFIRETRTVLP